MKKTPPRLARQLLKWFCHAEFVEETEGDLDELFRQRLREHGRFHAYAKYWVDVLHTITPYGSSTRKRKFSSSRAVDDRLRHFFKIAFRNMIRSKTSSMINLGGLSVSLASFLMITFYLVDEMTFDGMHADPDNTYRISYSFVGFDGKEDRDSRAAGMWSIKLKEHAPEVKQVVRFSRFGYPGNVWSDNPNHVFVEQQFYWVDSTFTEIFSLNLKTGGDVKRILSDPHAIIINESTAKKYFGDADAVGKAMTYVRDGMSFEFIVGGVMKDYPSNSHVKPDLIANCTALDPLWKRNSEDRINSWGDSFSYSFVLVEPGADISKLSKILQQLFNDNLGNRAETTHPVFVPLKEIHFTKGFLFELGAPGDKMNLYIFGSIALLIMGMACINYMNLATARSMRRSKEVGLRKTLGAGKGTLIVQFIGESLIMTFLSLTLAILLVGIFLPSFNDLTSKDFTLLEIMQTKMLWVVVGATFLIGFVSGSYPAFYLSSFKPIIVLKGILNPQGGHEKFRKVLVVVQISITILFLTCAYAIHTQLSFINDSKLGVYKDQIVTVRLGDVPKEKLAGYKQLVQQNSNVGDISTGPHLPRRENFGNMARKCNFVSLEKKDLNWDVFTVDADFAAMFNIELIAGRNISQQNPGDTSSIILNEAAVRELGVSPEQALGLESEDDTFYFVKGELVRFTHKRKVIGVVKDFNYESVKKSIRPIIITGVTDGSEMMYVRLNSGSFPQTLDYLQQKWNEIYPATPFQYWFLDEEFGRLYQAERQMGNIFTWLSGMAILIACLGLFGLASFTAEQKTKEIGIRKVLGASTHQILAMLTSKFVKLTIIAFIIGGPLAYFIVHQWMETFAYKAEIANWVYGAAGLIVLIFTIVAVGVESLKAARTNPSDSMRHE